MRLLLILFVLLTAIPAEAATGDLCSQIDDNNTTDNSLALADSTKIPRKHPWLAGLEIVGFNGALLGIDKIIYKDEDWTHVTLKDIRRNLSHGYWVWDNDDLQPNAFRHPVHGSLFYLIARANGMNIWESSLYSLGGTWMWEVLCEAERPSINDMVYTSVGGATIGEVVWRTGKSWLGIVSKRHSYLRPNVPFSTSLTIGYRHLKSYGHQAIQTAMVTMDVSYGDLFDVEHTGLFDYFEASGTLTIGQNKKGINKNFSAKSIS